MNSIGEMAQWLKNHDDIALIGHIRPDGDTLGATLALKDILEQMGKRCAVVFQDEVPEVYKYMPGNAAIVHKDEIGFEVKSAVGVDVSDTGRMGDCAEVFEKAENTASIDHHESNQGFADVNFVWPDASSTCEMIVRLGEELGAEFTKDIALNAYTGLATDTGNFNFSNTSPETYFAAGTLAKTGIDISELSRRLFRIKSVAKMRLMGKVLDKAEFFEDGRINCAVIDAEMFRECAAKHEDADQIVNQLLDTQGVKVAVLGEELAYGIKFSLRSEGSINVAEVCQTMGGGGHDRAAGVTIKNGSIEDAKSQVLEAVKKALQKG